MDVSFWCSFFDSNVRIWGKEAGSSAGCFAHWMRCRVRKAGEIKNLPKPTCLKTTILASMQIHGAMFREMTNLVFNQNNTPSLISVVYILMLHLVPESVLLNVLILTFLKWKVFPKPTLHLSVAKQVVR